jgi:hypothetical protein
MSSAYTTSFGSRWRREAERCGHTAADKPNGAYGPIGVKGYCRQWILRARYSAGDEQRQWPMHRVLIPFTLLLTLPAAASDATLFVRH